jgi:hypothetical protein
MEDIIDISSNSFRGLKLYFCQAISNNWTAQFSVRPDNVLCLFWLQHSFIMHNEITRYSFENRTFSGKPKCQVL